METIKGIITSDWHLRQDKPICRTDEDWIETQRNVLNSIVDIANEKDCPIYIVGDIFHKPKVDPVIVSLFLHAITKLKNEIHIFPGNHDLLYHNIKYGEHSSYGILQNISYLPKSKIKLIAEHYKYIYYGMEIKLSELQDGTKHFFIHKLIFPSAKERPIESAGLTAQELSEKIPDNFKWIFLGDYHKEFHVYEKAKKRHIINPGCITSQAADYKDYQPVIYYVDTTLSKVEKINIPAYNKNITDHHLIKKNKRDDRINTFIESIKNKKGISLSFMDNLDKFIDSNSKKIKKGSIKIIDELRSKENDNNRRTD